MHHACGLRWPERNVGWLVMVHASVRIKVVALLNANKEGGSDERYFCGKRKHQYVNGPLAHFESWPASLFSVLRLSLTSMFGSVRFHKKFGYYRSPAGLTVRI